MAGSRVEDAQDLLTLAVTADGKFSIILYVVKGTAVQLSLADHAILLYLAYILLVQPLQRITGHTNLEVKALVS